tara:strand:- start:398 stop:799 length:402 start_codon:yes stop_codon:yes gene_type:complete
MTKFLFWIKPESKTVLRNLAICVFFIFLIIYSHTEYINWSEISGNTEHITQSFILKNVLIVFSIIVLIFSIRKSKLKDDGFDKYRNRPLETASQKKLKPQEHSTKTEIDDTYFDKFRKKEKLRTTQEIKLGKK